MRDGGRQRVSHVADRERVALSWSGGKDSAMALHELRRSDEVDVASLLTIVAAEYDRVSHHGVRASLLREQAAAIGLPLRTIAIETQSPSSCDTNLDANVMREYERLMRDEMLQYKAEGITNIAFGDIFLQPLRDYRERKLAEVGMRGLFPLWQRDTATLAREFVDLGFKAYLSCVDDAKLGASFAGRAFDHQLLADLPPRVDPCGEHGEYHSFVFDGPIFQRPLAVSVGEVVQRDVRHFADLVLKNVEQVTSLH